MVCSEREAIQCSRSHLPLTPLDCLDEDGANPVNPQAISSSLTRRRTYQLDGLTLSLAKSIEVVASSMFVLVTSISQKKRRSSEAPSTRPSDLPYLSREVTVGRNSQFHNLTAEDRLRLGGIEYRSLKLLLKIVSGTHYHCADGRQRLTRRSLLLWPAHLRCSLLTAVDP